MDNKQELPETQRTDSKDADVPFISDENGSVFEKQDFQYFKRSVDRRVLFTALLFGVCCGLVAAGGSLLALKLFALQVKAYLYLVIAASVGVALIAFGVFWLLTKQSDEKLAAKLDKVYRLGESVQTMVQYKDARTGVAELQREAANEKLAKVKRKKATAGHILALILVPVLAVSTLVMGVAAPQKTIAEPPKWEDQTHEIRQSQINELKNLIKNVENDEELLALQPLPEDGAGSSLVVEYTDALNVLLTALEGELTNQQFVNGVQNAMRGVMSATAAKTSYKAIAPKLKEQESVAFLGEAIAKAAKAYGEAGTDYSFVKDQAKEGKLYEAVKAAIASGTQKVTDAVAECNWSNYNAVVLGYRAGMVAALENVSVAEDDKLLAAVDAMSLAFMTLGNVSENDGFTLSILRGYLDTNAVGPFDKDGTAAMYEQSYYTLMKEYICNSLHEIFEVEIPAETDGNGGGEDGDNNQNDDNNEDDHEHNKFTNWPSADLIIDGNGKKVHYGEILDGGNYAKIVSLLDKEDLPKEIRDYIVKYLDEIKSSDNGTNE